ncbi:MAG: hypothetical protein RIQ54_65, partial [Candidatus Parcubacteria bacterium]
MKFFSFLTIRVVSLLVASAVVGISCAIIAVGGYYPVALVNGHWITAATFWQNRDAAFLFEHRRLSLEAGKEVDIDEHRRLIIQAGVLERLIENALIHNRAEQEIGADFAFLVQQTISR